MCFHSKYRWRKARLICWCIFKFLLHRCSVLDLCPCIVYLYILFICHSEMPGSLKYFFYTPLAPYSLTYWHLFYFSKFIWYCTISNCLAWPVTHDHCTEILLRQRPVWRVILAKFRQTKISAGHSQAWVLSECFVTAGQGQCDPWLHTNFGAVKRACDPCHAKQFEMVQYLAQWLIWWHLQIYKSPSWGGFFFLLVSS